MLLVSLLRTITHAVLLPKKGIINLKSILKKLVIYYKSILVIHILSQINFDVFFYNLSVYLPNIGCLFSNNS